MRSLFFEWCRRQYTRTTCGLPERLEGDRDFAMSGQRVAGYAYRFPVRGVVLTRPSWVRQRLHGVCNAGNRHRVSAAKADCVQDCHLLTPRLAFALDGRPGRRRLIDDRIEPLHPFHGSVPFEPNGR